MEAHIPSRWDGHVSEVAEKRKGRRRLAGGGRASTLKENYPTPQDFQYENQDKLVSPVAPYPGTLTDVLTLG